MNFVCLPTNFEEKKLVEACNVVQMCKENDLEVILATAIARGMITRPYTRLPLLCADGQGPYLRSIDHLGRSTEVKKKKDIM